jgi:hypothetical protein
MTLITLSPPAFTATVGEVRGYKFAQMTVSVSGERRSSENRERGTEKEVIGKTALNVLAGAGRGCSSARRRIELRG